MRSRTHHPIATPFLLLLAVGCGPGVLGTTAGDFGVTFSEDPDCVEIDTSSLDIAAPFTIDMFIKAGDEGGFAFYPLAVWPGAFALYQNRDGYSIFGPTDDTEATSSAATPTSFLDGGYHHVAATYDTDGSASLYLDGDRLVSAPLSLLDDPGDRLYLGCWPGHDDAWLTGTIGELRLQSVLHYDSDFAPTWEEYEPAEAILGLWHLNEGRGTAILDAQGDADGELEGGEWVEFLLPGYDPDDDPPDTGD